MKALAFCVLAFVRAVAAKDMCPDLNKFAITCDADFFAGSMITSKGYFKPKATKPSVIKQYDSAFNAVFANGCSALMERTILDGDGNEVKYMLSCTMEDQQENTNEGRMSCSNHGFQGMPGVVEVEVLIFDDDNIHLNGRFTSGTVWKTTGAEEILEAWTNKCKKNKSGGISRV
jgi:hypothetical protein